MTRSAVLPALAALLTPDPTGSYVSATAPPAFDVSNRIATTQFVKQSGLTYGLIRSLSAATALTSADAGKLIFTTGTSAYSVTLPPASTVAAGATVTFVSAAAVPISVARSGNDVIQVNTGTLASLPLGAGDTLSLVSNGVGLWVSSSGSAQLGYSAVFGASVGQLTGGAGYQKLPSGLIIQWGNDGQSGTTTSVTYPIAFPHQTLSAFATLYAAGSLAYATVSTPGPTATGLTLVKSAGLSTNWLAIGF